ncbi:hypothetical protein SAMN02910263_00486 [Butyrivibrio sp. INlla16]|nr:hypothetical protein SAMN02910263_00486 [Butyrivibrio sp. INlla16]
MFLGVSMEIKKNFIKAELYKALSVIVLIPSIFLGTSLAAGCSKTGNGQVTIKNTEKDDDKLETADFRPEDGYLKESEEVLMQNGDVESDQSSQDGENAFNTEFSLSVPTYVTRIDDKWFIVDCYHDQIIYNYNMTAPLNEWRVLTKEAKQPHTIAGDGSVILVDDTENNRVLVYEKRGDSYVNTQLFNDIGKRPHYTVYDEEDKAFYVWSSTTGEMYIFRHAEDDTKMYLTEIRDAGTKDTYIRSFYIDGEEIYFVSGIGSDGQASGILVCDKHSFDIKERIEVPDDMAGMVALRKDGGYFYITVSTDITGNQDAATMIRTKDLHGLLSGDYEEIYSEYFVGGGTPYNITRVGDTLYLTEHRVPGHSVWSYKIENDEITDVQALY